MTDADHPPGHSIAYLSAGQAAERLGCPLNTVTSYIRRGQFPPHDATIGRNRGWLPATIDRWEAPGTSQVRDQHEQYRRQVTDQIKAVCS